MGKIFTILAWVSGLVGLMLFGGFLASLGQTGIKALSHGHFQGGMSSVIILCCAVGLGAATAIFGALGISTAGA